MPRFDTVYWPGLDPGALASSKLSVTDTNNALLATNVDEAIDELAAAAAANTSHPTDPVGAHAASAISLLDSGGEYATNNVEGALEEAASRVQAAEDAITAVQAAAAATYPKIVAWKDIDADSSSILGNSAYVWYSSSAVTHTFDPTHVYVYELMSAKIRFDSVNWTSGETISVRWVRDVNLSENGSTLGELEFNVNAQGPSIEEYRFGFKHRDISSLSGEQTVRLGLQITNSVEGAGATHSIVGVGTNWVIWDYGPYTT